MLSLFTLKQRSGKSILSMTGLRNLSKRSLNGRVGHAGPATTGRNLRSLGSKTSTYSLFCLAI